jgi:membrane-associated phospholipid phosphatase
MKDVNEVNKRITFVAALVMLAVFPSGLFPQGIPAEGTKDSPAPVFSLSVLHALALPAAYAAPLPPEPERYTFRNVTSDFPKDAGQIWSYPFHIKSGDILPIVGLAALTGVLIHNDKQIHESFVNYRNSNSWVQKLGPNITQMGQLGAYGTAAVFLGVGLIAGDHKLTETGVLAANAMLQAGVLVEFLKGIIGRQRPVIDGFDRWSGPVGFFKRYSKGGHDLYDSFPGGHTATAFSLATVVAMEFRETVWVPILSYAVATGVGLSRVTLGRHWLSDCLVGGVLGHFIGRLVVNNHRQRYHVTPVIGMTGGSVSFAFTVSR